MKILIADSNSITQNGTQTFLQGLGHETITAENGEQALEILRGENPPAVALLDQDLTGIKALEVCERLKRSHPNSPTYKVLLTNGSIDVNEALFQGADDLILERPLPLHTLKIRLAIIERNLHVQQQNARLKEENQRLNELALKDPLTGAYNRRYFLEKGEKEFAKIKRTQEPLSVIGFDLDYFKEVNDTYGHEMGDCVLKEVVRCCLKHLRPGDDLCRIGGDEFFAILPGTTASEAAQVAERLREAVSQLALRATDDRWISLTASFGAGQVMGSDIKFQNVVNLADKALYDVKKTGRNRVAIREGVQIDDMIIEKEGTRLPAEDAHRGGDVPPGIKKHI